MPVAVMASVVHRVDRSAFRRPREDGPRKRDSRAEFDPAVVVVVAVVALVAVVAVARRRRTYRLGVAHRVSGR